MPSIADTELPPPKSWDAFEELCADLFEREWNFLHTVRYGRQGQRQNGVDVHGRRDGSRHAGVQCKGKRRWPPRKLTKAEIDREVAKALKFRPQLQEFIFATTADNDSLIQDHVNQITAHHETKGLFSVHVYWWGEITRRVTRHDDLTRKHFPFAIPLRSAPAQEVGAMLLPVGILDREIGHELDQIRRSRFFGSVNSDENAEQFAMRLLAGDLQGGSPRARADALSWCARLLAYRNTSRADELLTQAKLLTPTDASRCISGAFVLAAKGDRDGALLLLSRLETPVARTAAFIIANNEHSFEETVEWMSLVGFKIFDLDSDGKFHFVAKCLGNQKWDTALESVATFEVSDFNQTPALLYSAAVSHLVQAVPEEYRSLVLSQIPFELDSFPLESTDEKQPHLRHAREYFERCRLAAEQLGLQGEANLAADYGLWLWLRDRNGRVDAINHLRSSMSDPRHSLRRLNFAVRFGLAVNVDEAEREIDRQTALTGGKSVDAAFGRFVLAFKQSSEAEVAAYISKHRRQLTEHIDPTSIARVEVEMLSRSGQLPLAEQRLAELVRGGLDDRSRRALERMIAEGRGEDPIGSRISEYEASPSLNGLYNLIDLLEANKSWQLVAHYAENLVKQVTAVESAVKFTRALYELGEMGRIHELLSQYPEFLAQSEYLKSVWCICLFECGDLRRSAHVLSELRKANDRSEYREMTVRLAVATGNWDSLATFIDSEWNSRDSRDVAELVNAAQLALAVQPNRARDFARDAVAKAKGDPEILITAYTIATHGGWEDESEAGEWLRGAIERSGESGPLEKVSISDLIDRAPAWNKREESAWKSLKQGEIPVFGAARMLNRTLCDLFLLPALANQGQPDPRKRSHIFAYSGAVHRNVQASGRVALDATALLTLGILRLVGTVIEASAEVIIPHTTLWWLFDEKQRIKFHQPSRIEAATEIRSLIHDGKLDRFVPTFSSDPALVNEVGQELAALLGEASGAAEAGPQRLVIRSSPVHKVGSLMDENANLEAYSGHLCSCQSVIEKLRETGSLTDNQFRKAQAYLAASEMKWPNEPQIQDGADLYLDGLAVNYLQRVGALAKLKQAGFRAIVSKFETAETSSLLAYSALARQAEETIEHIRASLAAGIESGKVRVGPLPRDGGKASDNFRTHPTVSILDVAATADTVVVDDRFVNQHVSVNADDRSIPIVTSFELLDSLTARGYLPRGDYLDRRTMLRFGGYLFASLKRGELEEHLANSIVREGALVESADLKAVRENIQQSRMSASLILPKESAWLLDLQKTLANVLGAQWFDGVDLDNAAARSDWLLALLDMRGWAHGMGFDAGQSVAQDGYMSLVFATMHPPIGTDKKVVSAYWKWLEASVLKPLRTSDPAKFEALVKQAHALIIHAIESKEVSDTDGDD